MKVINVDNWDELARFSKFPYDSGSYMRTGCRNCHTLAFPLCSIIQKYREWDCPNCGYKNQEPYIFPDAALMFQVGPFWRVIYKN